MAGRCRQLLVLLWKNFRIRLKQKVFLVGEIVPPMLLIVLTGTLFALRDKSESTGPSQGNDGRDNNPRNGPNQYAIHDNGPTVGTFDQKMDSTACYFSPSPLPSAGFVPFLESAFIPPTDCVPYRISDRNITSSNDPGFSRFPKIIDFVKHVLHTKDAAKEVSKTLESVVKLMVEFNGGQGDCTALKKALEEFNGLGIKKGLDALNSLLFDSFKNGQSADKANNILCSDGNCHQYPRLESYEKILDSQGTTTNGNEDICKKGAIDELCSSAFTRSEVGYYEMNRLASITRGYILVTPKNKQTEEIVGKMKEWLGGFEWMKEFVLDFYRNADNYQSSFTSSNLSTAIIKLNEQCGREEKAGLEMDRLMQLFQRDHESPLLTTLRDKIKPVAAWLKCFSTDRFHFVNSVVDLKNKKLCLEENKKFFAGLVFDMSNPNVRRYNITMPKPNDERNYGRNDKERHLHYFKSGFIFLQDAVDRAIIETSNRTVKLQAIGVYTQQFPRLNAPSHSAEAQRRSPNSSPPQDKFGYARMLLFLIGMMLSWLPSVCVIVKNIVYEKEMRLKEFMKMMGLTNFVLWLSWFIQSFIQLAIGALVIAGFAKLGFVKNADFFVVFLFLLLSVAALITEAFLISTWFSRTNFAAVCTGFIYLALYAPFIASFVLTMQRSELKLTESGQLGLCLIPQCAFGFGCFAIFAAEISGTGIQWSDLWEKPPEVVEIVRLGHSMAMLLVGSLINIFLTWYIEAVFPGEFGVPHPFYFFVTPSYWCPRVSLSAVSTTLEIPPDVQPFCEAEPTHVKLGVAVRKLRKVFSNGKVALSNVSVNFYESQITSFLGHNGAGKTTTMSIIAGLFPPSTGTVFIYGLDVRKSIEEIRKSMGLCPQHNILFEMLSTRQQLIFYSALKGVTWATAKCHAQNMINELKMQAFADKPAKDLSGGMKRRLSVGAAFIGGSKVVLLDEPTAGVDPSARRQIWDLLLKFKQGRTIIMSTHHMDEADVLGDRIAIIGAGQMRCVGSSMFLKKKYASGYRLTVVRMNPSSTPTSSPISSDFEQTRNDFIKSMFPDASIVEDLGQELTYNIPSSDPKKLQHAFVELEAKKDTLGIASFGISESKLEEVFLKAVGNEAGEAPPKSFWEKIFHRKAKSNVIKPASNSDSGGSDTEHRPAAATPSSSASTSMQRLTGVRLWCLQFRALFMKRLRNSLRNLKGALMEVFIPLLLVVLVIASPSIIKSVSTDRSSESTDQDESSDRIGGALAASRFGKAVVFQSFDGTNIGLPNLMEKIKEQIDPIGGTVDSLPNSSINDWLLATAGKKKRFGGYSLGDPSGAYIHAVDWNAIRKNIAELNVTLDQFMKEAGIEKMKEETSVSSRGNFSAFLRGVDVKHNIKIWFNNSIAAPIYMNVLSNAILRSVGSNLAIETIDDSFDPQQTPTVTTTRIERSDDRTAPECAFDDTQRQRNNDAALVCLVLALVFCYVPPCYVMFIIEETRTFAKHLQFVSGVPPILYWVVAFVWDMINYLIIVSGIVIALVAFETKNFAGTSDTASATCLILFSYGFAMIPMMYLFTFYFETPSIAFVVLSISNTFFGYILVVISMMTQDIDVRNNLRYGLSIFPQFALIRGTMELAMPGMSEDPNARRCPREPKVTDFVPFFVPMFVGAFIWFGLVLLIEHSHDLGRMFRKPSLKGAPVPLANEDEDVRTERFVLADPTNRGYYVLKIMNLSKMFKYFGRPPFVAVNNLSVGVRPGECFGLLGVNGAGKTTTFSMLTAKIPITSGDALVCGKSVLMQPEKVRYHIGFCPQFDALHARLTAREELRFYAQVRGVPARMVDEVVERLIKELGLTVHADRQAGTYSGGNKRKLSTAVAMIGSPELILLDEPTAGMDPKARRGLWNRMKKILKRGDCSIVLTSHSMEECEALCNRIGIMVAGSFRCLGSTQHLKNRFGQGYTLTMKLGSVEQKEGLKGFMQSRFPGIEVKEEHASLVRFKLPPTVNRLSAVFASVVEAMSKFQIDDYTLSQPTLEEIFIGFAQQDVPAVQGVNGKDGKNAKQGVVAKKA